MMRPWPDATSDAAFESLDALGRLIALGVERGLSEPEADRYVASIKRLAEILPAPQVNKP